MRGAMKPDRKPPAKKRAPRAPEKSIRANRLANLQAAVDKAQAELDAAQRLYQSGPGRPTSYRPEFAGRVTTMCMLGLTNAEIGERFGVSKSSIEEYIVKVDEFRRAVYKGREGADEMVVNSLFKSAHGFTHPEDDIRTVALGNNQGSEIVITKTVKHYPPNERAIAHWLHVKQRARFPSPNSALAQGDGTPMDLAAQARAAVRAALRTVAAASEEAEDVPPSAPDNEGE